MTTGAMILLQLFGCDALNKAFSSVGGLTDATVVQGAVLGIEVPDDPRLAPFLEGTDFAPGTAVTVFVADATSIADLGNAPVDGGVVTVSGDISEDVPGLGGGLYATDPSSSELEYTDGAQWVVDVDTDGTVGTAILDLPPAAAFDVEPIHEPGAPMTIDLSGQGFQSSVAVVIDEQGTVTWTNAPTDISGLYAAMDSDDAGVVEIPGSAFAGEGLYAVGVAAMSHTNAEDLTGINTALSKLRVGKMRIVPVSTIPLP